MMFTFDLRTLGGVDLRRSDGGPPPAVRGQPKRLALLTYLALARPRGSHSRDKLLPLFWPTFDERRGRNALNQALHVLRKSLDDDVIRSLGNQAVAVNRDLLRTDVEVFEHLLEQGKSGAAFELYRGEFLPGLHVPGCVGFGHWLDLEQARLRRMARAAAQAATIEAEASPGTAIRMLSRAMELFPTDEELFRTLGTALASVGDRAGVERAYDVLQLRLSDELGAEPSEETRAFVRKVQRGGEEATAEATAPDKREEALSIAVLPLRTPKTTAYSSEGMTEALIGELGKVRSLRVISHQSVRRFRDSRQSVAEIARILGVDALVEGMVVEGGGRVRVTAQLVRAEPEKHVWSDAFEADARDILAVHREIARAVATAVSAAISVEEQAELDSTERVDPDAYELYLQGWMNHSTIVPGQVAHALQLYRESIELDPLFGPSRANLGIIYFILIGYGELSVEEGLPQMKQTVEVALKLDPALWQGHIARSGLRMHTHDWASAESDLSHAARIAPNQAMAHAHRTIFLTGMGRFDEASETARQARAVDPLAPFAHWIGGWSSHYAGRPHAAIRQLRSALELFPDYPMAWIFLAKSHYQAGDWSEALHACRRSLELMPESPMVLGYTAHILAALGESAAADEAMERFEREGVKRGFASPHYTAAALSGLGRREEAFKELNRINARASALGFLLPCDPLLDPLRDDARFDAVLERVGLEVWPHYPEERATGEN